MTADGKDSVILLRAVEMAAVSVGQMPARIAFLLLVAVCAAALAGCGFHLKGGPDVPEAFSRLKLSGDDPQLIDTLREMLERNGASVTADETAAEIRIVRSDYRKTVETVDDRGVATGYAYRYTVEYRILDGHGAVLVPDGLLSQVASLRYEAGNELEIEDEETFMKRQMTSEIAERIIRQLRWL
ncbi:MAG: hypothetical protein F4Z15_08360 [Gammaproteobacteria bacterium]|nr:hypothetical protein [Gammaproteobacteria bacterium]MYD77084.1 hypothetical protein [Gammaproteobacteria bacterium]MYJ51484.1 hypothetical protein [Gammaproteobacteria bacterium]